MSPYEVKLLIEIDVGLRPLTAKKTYLFYKTINDFYERGFVRLKDYEMLELKTTKLGRAVCNRFYAVDERDMKFCFCGQCGQQIE